MPLASIMEQLHQIQQAHQTEPETIEELHPNPPRNDTQHSDTVNEEDEQLHQLTSQTAETIDNDRNFSYITCDTRRDNTVITARRVLDLVLDIKDEQVQHILKECIKEVWKSPKKACPLFKIRHDQREEIISNQQLSNLLLTPQLLHLSFTHTPAPLWNADTELLRWKCRLIGRDGQLFEQALSILRETAMSASPFFSDSPQQYVFQMNARLFQTSRHYWLISNYLDAIRDFALGNQIHPLVPCFEPPFGPHAHLSSFPAPIRCMESINSPDLSAVVVSTRSIFLLTSHIDSEEYRTSNEASERTAFTQVAADVQKISVSNDATLLAIALKNGLFLVWDIATRRVISTPICQTSHMDDVVAMAISSKNTHLVVVYRRGVIRTWEIPSACLLYEATVRCDRTLLIGLFALMDDGRFVATCDVANVFGITDTTTGDYHSHLMPLPFTPAFSVGSPDARCMAWASEHDGNILVTDMTMYAAKQQPLHGQRGRITALAVNSDLSVVATGASDGMVRIWCVAHPTAPRQIFNGHNMAVRHVSIRTCDKGDILSMDEGGGLRRWTKSVTDIIKRGMRTRHGEAVTCLTVTGDGRRAVSGARDGTLLVWDISGGEAVGGIVYAHKSEVTHVEIWAFDMVTSYSVREAIVWRINGSCLEKVKVQKIDINDKFQESMAIPAATFPLRNGDERDNRNLSINNTSIEDVTKSSGAPEPIGPQIGTVLFSTSSTASTPAAMAGKAAASTPLSAPGFVFRSESEGTPTSPQLILPIITLKSASTTTMQRSSTEKEGNTTSPLSQVDESNKKNSEVKEIRVQGTFEGAHMDQRKTNQESSGVICHMQSVIDRNSRKVLATLPSSVSGCCAWCVSDDGTLLVTGLVSGDVFWFEIES